MLHQGSLGFTVEGPRFWGVMTPQNLGVHHGNSQRTYIKSFGGWLKWQIPRESQLTKKRSTKSTRKPWSSLELAPAVTSQMAVLFLSITTPCKYWKSQICTRTPAPWSGKKSRNYSITSCPRIRCEWKFSKINESVIPITPSRHWEEKRSGFYTIRMSSKMPRPVKNHSEHHSGYHLTEKIGTDSEFNLQHFRGYP